MLTKSDNRIVSLLEGLINDEKDCKEFTLVDFEGFEYITDNKDAKKLHSNKISNEEFYSLYKDIEKNGYSFSRLKEIHRKMYLNKIEIKTFPDGRVKISRVEQTIGCV